MKPIQFNTAFTYPFNRWPGLFNILWILLPIFGWAALLGYHVRQTQGWVKGEFKEMPKFSFVKDMKRGFWMFIMMIPLLGAFILAGFILTISTYGLGALGFLFLALFILPLLLINLYVKETVEDSFDFKVVKPVFDHFDDYLVMLLKSFGLVAVWIVMAVIVVGIPANMFTKNIFLADFYRRRVK